jgi:hypothetical protein
MSDTERCAVIGLRSGIVPSDPNTFFDGSQIKCQFFSWLTVSIRIIYSLYEHIQLTTTFLLSRRFGFCGPSSCSGGPFFNCFSDPEICFMNFELGEPAHRAINHRVALPGLYPRVFDPL